MDCRVKTERRNAKKIPGNIVSILDLMDCRVKTVPFYPPSKAGRVSILDLMDCRVKTEPLSV